MKLKEVCLLAISDTQLLFGAVVGVLLLWVGFRILKSMLGSFFKIFVILLLLAAAGGIFYMLQHR